MSEFPADAETPALEGRMMKHANTNFALFCISLVCGLFQSAAVFSQETAGQLLARINKLTQEKRQEVLAEKAKAEKEVTFYSSMSVAQMEALSKAFSKRYPFIKVNTYRSSGERAIAKIQTELQAKRTAADVINISAAQGAPMKAMGALDPYHSPQRESFPVDYKDKEGYFTSFYITPIVLGYNTTLVKRAEAPKNYDDLLSPKWKGEMLMDDEPYEWYGVLMRHLGRERGVQYMKRLAQQNLSMHRGRTNVAQMLVAGEGAIGITLSGNSALELKEKGAPLDWVALDPYFSQANMIMLARYAPHPHAAALFLDWSLSEEGQSIVTSFGRVVARNGVKQRFPELMQKKSRLVDMDLMDPKVEKSLIKEFREIFIPTR
jgi:iron(III) transport system substrate-binding protein